MVVIYFILFISSICTLVNFKRDRELGLATAVFFFILLPTEVRIPLPGALPELTAHRLLLVLCAFQVLAHRLPETTARQKLPLTGMLVLIAMVRGISMFLADEFVPAFKDLFAFLLETVLFFILVWGGVRGRDGMIRILWGVAYAVIGIACIAWVERFTGENYAARWIPGIPDYSNSTSATFRHRIQFGYAMAMGFPIIIALALRAKNSWQKWITWAGMALLPAACYFSNSRGAWAGMALGGMVLFLTATPAVRKRMILVGVLGVCAIMTRPGVWETVERRWNHTFSSDTHKGRSASYRLELWRVANEQLKTGPGRFLFGFGGGNLESMDLSAEFELGGGTSDLGYTSWDSEYAANFMKFGWVGFLIELLLYLAILKWALRAWRSTKPEHMSITSALIGTLIVYLWAMTNVAIFNPQLMFLFWLAVAMAVRSVEFAHQEENQTQASRSQRPHSELSEAMEGSMGCQPGY